MSAIGEAFPDLSDGLSPPRHEDGDFPLISVVVPTAMSRPQQLDASVAHLRRLDYPRYEILIIDNRPAGAPSRAIDGVTVVREARPGISAARNAGLAMARGQIIAFTDDDVEVDPGWLRAIAERFLDEPALTGVSGLVVPCELETPAQIWFEESGLGLDRQYSALTFRRGRGFSVRRVDRKTGDERVDSLYATGEFGLGSNMAFRTDYLRSVGGFDLALGAGTPTHGGEDLAMLIGLLTDGRALGYEPAAVIFHKHRQTVDEFRRQSFGYGSGLTAMLTAICLRRPRHILGLLAVVPKWLQVLRHQESAKQVNRSGGFPPDIGRREMVGMVWGPVAYLQAVVAQRRWRP